MDLRLPDWLTPNTTPWQQLAVGAQVGAHIAQARYRNQALKLQVEQQAQQDVLRMRELALRDEQQTILNQARLDAMEEQQANLTDVPLLNQYAKDPSGKMPSFRSPKSFAIANQIAENYSKSQAGQAWQATQKQFWDRFGELPGDEQATITDMLRESKGQVTADIYRYAGKAYDNRPRETPAIIEANEVARLRKLADTVRESDPVKADESLRKAAQIEAKALGPSETMEVYMDEAGQPHYRVTKGGTGTGQTTGVTRAKIEQSLRGSRESLDLMDQLHGELRAKDLGFYGVIGETVMDRLLPQFGVKSMDDKRAENRTKLKEFVQGAVRQISPDNRFSNEDRQRVEALLPNTGVLENVDHAKRVISTIEEIFAKRNIRDMQQIGLKIEPEKLNNAELVAAAKLGIIDKDAALKIIQSRP